ncbi:Metalloprotease [Rostrohypoxylon terebratum]|nr:Metalloprotease [Rostrohypoxylon terebratum]
MVDMDKLISKLRVDNPALQPNYDSRGPLALCGNPSMCWTANTTKYGKDPSDGRLIISVAIMNSTSQARDDFVGRTARVWQSYANIKFKFVSFPEPSDIRILYGNRSWSYVGIDALNHDSEVTMCLKYIDGDDQHNQRIVLHEFGHALGFEHEHSSPKAGIQWKKRAVFEKYEGTYTRKQIRRNFFKVAHDATISSPYDLNSIMGYSLSRNLVRSGLVSTKLSTGLSRNDMDWAQEFYPFFD